MQSIQSINVKNVSLKHSVRAIKESKYQFGSSHVSGWALPTDGWACWTSVFEVGCLRQTECATDSHNHQSQELCCFRSRHLEQPTNRPASFVTVDGNFCTTLEGTPVPQHWMTYACSASEFFKAALVYKWLYYYYYYFYFTLGSKDADGKNLS